MEYTPRMLDAALTARSAAAAGMVLLKNVQNALPLTAEDGEALPVAVFGSGQIFTPCCEAAMDPWRKVSVLDGLCASDAVKPDGLLSHKYRTWALEHPAGGEYPLGSLSMEELAGCNRAAIVVIARRPEQTDCTLTDSETQMLRSVTTAFDRTILVLATPGFVELNDAAMACQAIVWMGIAGQEAGSALAVRLWTRLRHVRTRQRERWTRWHGCHRQCRSGEHRRDLAGRGGRAGLYLPARRRRCAAGLAA